MASLHAQFGNDVLFHQFEQWQRELCVPHDINDKACELRLYFEYLDPYGTGLLTHRQLRTLLGNYGEALTEEEVNIVFE